MTCRVAFVLAVALSSSVQVQSFRINKPHNRSTCFSTVFGFKKTCGQKGEGCVSCVESGIDKLEKACGDKAKNVAASICKGRDNSGEGRKCGRTLIAFKQTCGKKGDDCGECVEEGMGKLQEACGDKADRVAKVICKGRGGDGDKDLRRKCAQVWHTLTKTCSKKGEHCDACVEQGLAKVDAECGKKFDEVAPLICKKFGQGEKSDEEGTVEDVVGVAATIPVNIEDCGGADHAAKIIDIEPKSVNTGATTILSATGTLSRDISGGTFNLVVKMTGFPWSTLGEIKDADICQSASVDLRSGFIYGGKLSWQGLDCPVSAGEVTAKLEATLSSSLPSGLLNARIDIDAKDLQGQPLICAASALSR